MTIVTSFGISNCDTSVEPFESLVTFPPIAGLIWIIEPSLSSKIRNVGEPLLLLAFSSYIFKFTQPIDLLAELNHAKIRQTDVSFSFNLIPPKRSTIPINIKLQQ